MRLLALLTMLIFGGAVQHQAHAEDHILIDSSHQLQIPVSFTSCKTTGDCVLVEEMCASGWQVLNKAYQKEAEDIVQEANMAANCIHLRYIKPRLACIEHYCTILPDADKCMKRSTSSSGHCEVTCTRLDELGRCRHTCTAGAPCN